MEKLSSDTWARVKVETVLTVSLCKFFALCLIVLTLVLTKRKKFTKCDGLLLQGAIGITKWDNCAYLKESIVKKIYIHN